MAAQFLETAPRRVSLASEILRKERYHQHYARTAFDNSAAPSSPLMSRERNFFKFLESVDLLVEGMRDRRRGHNSVGSANALVDLFQLLIHSVDAHVATTFDHHRYKPDIAIVLATFLSQGPTIRQLALEDRELVTCRRLVETCISACRQKLESEPAKTARKKFDQRQKENTASCSKYFDALLRKSPQLFVFRVDLYAPIRNEWWELRDICTAEDGVDQLLRRLREGRVVENLLGYVVARESGPCRGLHYSLLAAQTGYISRGGHEGAAAVGKEWSNLFYGAGENLRAKASHFNCYELRQPSQFNGIGHIDVTAPQSRIALNAALKGMWDKPITFNSDMIKCNLIKNPAGTLGCIKTRNLRKGKM